MKKIFTFIILIIIGFIQFGLIHNYLGFEMMCMSGIVETTSLLILIKSNTDK